jgi:hypothetical protein
LVNTASDTISDTCTNANAINDALKSTNIAAFVVYND